MMSTQVLTQKFGPVGGEGGSHLRDMNTDGISRIVKISVYRSAVIEGFLVRYIRDGREESTELLGRVGGNLSEFHLRPSEYITAIKGYIGTYNGPIVMKSLQFETNLGTFGPYGTPNGVLVELPALGGKIVGFHGRGGPLVYALGVYVQVSTESPTMKVGPFGGKGGTVRDMDITGVTRVVKISVRHSINIDALEVTCLRNGLEESTGQWGGNAGNLTEINLMPSEYITSVKGHTGRFQEWVVVKSLKFETNLQSFGPYGSEEGDPFEIPANGGQIIGFHGRAWGVLDALGVYIKVGTQVLTQKVGPVGGEGGSHLRDMNTDGISRIIKISVYRSAVIEGFIVRYIRDGREESTELLGRVGGNLSEILLQPSEYITAVKGYIGTYNGPIVMKSLQFETNLGSYGPYGTPNGVLVEIPAIGGKIIGFHGRGGPLVYALGAYVQVNTSGSSNGGVM